MNNQFDELTKQMAQSVTRRAALKKFGVGLAGMALACFGLANKARAAHVRPQGYCQIHNTFSGHYYTGNCVDPSGCVGAPSADCPSGTAPDKHAKVDFGCGGLSYPLDTNKGCNFAV